DLEARLPYVPERYADVRRALEQLNHSSDTSNNGTSRNTAPKETRSLTEAESADANDGEVRCMGVKVALPTSVQSALDIAASQMKGDYLLPNNPALRTVADWLEADGHLTEAICDEEAWVHAVEPDWLAYHVVESLA